MTTVWLTQTSLGQVSSLHTIFHPLTILFPKEYHLQPSHYNKYPSDRLLSRKELLPLLLLKRKLTDSSLKKKSSLYQRLKKE